MLDQKQCCLIFISLFFVSLSCMKEERKPFTQNNEWELIVHNIGATTPPNDSDNCLEYEHLKHTVQNCASCLYAPIVCCFACCFASPHDKQ